MIHFKKVGGLMPHLPHIMTWRVIREVSWH